MATVEPPDLDPELSENVALAFRRLPLLERAVELAGASLVGLRERLAKLDAAFQGHPRRALGPRLDRLGQDLGLIRRQIERLAGQLGVRLPSKEFPVGPA
jgi:hypothetical protein